MLGWKEDVTDLDFDAVVDAPNMGYDENWGEWCTRAVHAKKNEMPSKVQKLAMGGHTEIVGERVDGLQSGDMVGQLHTTLDMAEKLNSQLWTSSHTATGRDARRPDGRFRLRT